MPRTSAVESPGCPPFRALTTDVLGLVKVVEARGKSGTPKIVDTWGSPDASRSIVAASLADRMEDPILAVARKNGSIEFLNPLNGKALASIKVGESQSTDGASENDALVALHLFKRQTPDSSSMLGTLLACTEKGKVCLKSVAKENAPSDVHVGPSGAWDVCNAGKVQFSSVNANESYALFGGKGVEVNLWDITSCSKIWTAKSPRANSLGIFTPTWFTAGTFLCKDDHRKIVACTSNHQVRLYDTSTQRRPVISVDFRESPIKAITEDLDGHTVYIGTGSGDLASFDMRTGKLSGCYVGKCSGSIRSVVRHPELPLIASCGLDSYLRIWDTNTRQLLSAVFLKQHLTTVVIDSHFSAEEAEETKAEQPIHSQDTELVVAEGNDELELEERSSKSKKKNSETKKKKKKSRITEDDGQVSGIEDPDDGDSELHVSKRRKQAGEQSKGKKKKSKKQQVV